MEMNAMQSNLFVYYVTALIVGAAYYFGALYGFNFLGSAISPVFAHYQPDVDSVAAPILINIAISFLGSLIPAIVVIAIIHFTLHPNSKLFIFALSVSYLILAVWSILDNYNSDSGFLDLGYLYNLSGKALGGFLVLWLVCLVYLRSKPNKSLNPDAQNARAG